MYVYKYIYIYIYIYIYMFIYIYTSIYISCAAHWRSPRSKHIGGATTQLSTKLPHSARLIRNSTDLGPYSRTMPRALWWS